MFLGFTPAIVIGIIKGVITPAMTLLVLAWIDWTLALISFGYTNQEILHKLNLTIPENGITALVGPSGSGKTTTLNLIARFYDIASGSIKTGNMDIRGMRHDILMNILVLFFKMSI